MDTDLDLLFKQSKPAVLPKVKAVPLVSSIPAILETQDDAIKKPTLSRRQKAKAIAEPEERLQRTVFVGNLPVDICKSKALQRSLKKKFSIYGKIISIRFRSIGFGKALPRKIAYLTEAFHEDRDSVNAYVVMETEEGARACLVENSILFEGKHLRVDLAAKDRKNDTKKSVFIGNLPFNISEEKVWDFFGTCGQVTNVRLVRDRKTNLGKGFGYVTFAEKSAIELALQLAGSECAGRQIRISKCTKEGYHKETQLHKLKRNAQNNSDDLEKIKKKPAIKPAAGFAKKCASVAPAYVAKPSKEKKKSEKQIKATKSS